MEKIFFNCLLKSTQKPVNQHLWLNVLSAIKENKDYIIEYILVFENGNGEKIKNKNFVYRAYLSEFANKEQSYIRELIKLRTSIINSAATETVMAEVTIV